MKALTPDEKLMIQFYREAMEKGDPFCEVSLKSAAKKTGQKETAVKNIVKHLAQANFLKKIGEDSICLTQHGIRFIREQLEV